MIAVTFALPAESADFAKLTHDHEVRIVHTGVGEKAARVSIDAFLRSASPTLLISSGFAGALDEQLAVGDILVAENFTAAGLVETVSSLLPIAQMGKLTTASDVLHSAADRASLARKSGALAVDMETSFIAAACAARGVPMLSLRAISDTPAAPFPAPPNVLFNIERQRTNYAALLWHIAKQPSAIGQLAAFSKQIASARRAMTEALRLVLRSDLVGR